MATSNLSQLSVYKCCANSNNYVKDYELSETIDNDNDQLESIDPESG